MFDKEVEMTCKWVQVCDEMWENCEWVWACSSSVTGWEASVVDVIAGLLQWT